MALPDRTAKIQRPPDPTTMQPNEVLRDVIAMRSQRWPLGGLLLLGVVLVLGSSLAVASPPSPTPTPANQTVGDPVSLLHRPPATPAPAVGAMGLPPLPSLPHPRPKVASGVSYKQRVVELVNQARQEQGLPPLRQADELAAAAAYHSQDMAVDDYFDHDSYNRVNGQLVFERYWYERIGSYYSGWTSLGENIAVGYTTPESVMAGWMGSDAHRRNILSTTFREIGVGYYAGGSWGHYWTQDFGTRQGVYPLIINGEAYSTTRRVVQLYIYGEGWATQMRFSDDGTTWTDWEPFTAQKTWTLPAGNGEKQVWVQIRNGDTTYTSYDTIVLEEAPPILSVTPSSLTFLTEVGMTTTLPLTHQVQVENAGGATLNWRAWVNTPWLHATPLSGTQGDRVTLWVTTSGGLTAISGVYSASLTITSTTPGVENSPQTISVTLKVADQLKRVYLPVALRNYTPPTPPQVVGTLPTDQASDISVGTTLVVTFSEAMDPATLLDARFTLVGPDGTPISGTLGYDPISYTWTLTPATALAYETLYTATVDGDVADAEGTPMGPPYTWHFTTTISSTTPNDVYFGDQWAMTKVQAPLAWRLSKGDGALIAVLDTGVDLDHPDLMDKLWTNPNEIPGNGQDDDGNGYVDDVHGWDWINADGDPDDDHGHGTHVAGIAAAATDNGIGVAGMGWRATILPLKVMDANGSGTIADLAEAIRYAADQGAQVINMSLGNQSGDINCLVDTPALQAAVDYAHSKGVLLVAAAGNEGSSHLVAPATCRYTLGVASTGQGDLVSTFSNYGSYVSVAAPGETILSTAKGGGYVYMQGTSMATPLVSGLAALLYAANPGYTPDQVASAILDNAVDRGDPGWDSYYGCGRIDAYAALLNGAQGSSPLCLGTTTWGAEAASPSRGSTPLQPKAEYVPGQLILRPWSGLSSAALLDLLWKHGIRPLRWSYGGDLLVAVPEGQELLFLQKLAADPAVEYVQPNYVLGYLSAYPPAGHRSRALSATDAPPPASANRGRGRAG